MYMLYTYMAVIFDLTMLYMYVILYTLSLIRIEYIYIYNYIIYSYI